MAKLSRFDRRVMAKSFRDAHLKSHLNYADNNILKRTIRQDDTIYCFLFCGDIVTRGDRKNHLGDYCFVARGVYKDARYVVGIATEAKIQDLRSYDFALIDIEEWTGQEEDDKIRIQKRTGILVSPAIIEEFHSEY